MVSYSAMMLQNIHIFDMTSLAILLFVVVGCQSYHPHPLTNDVVEKNLTCPDFDTITVDASEIKHPLIKPVIFDITDGLNPEEAAILAVLVNPELKVERDRRKIAQAQVIQAGLLPNPQISFTLAIPHPKSEGKESVGSQIKGTARDQLSQAVTGAITGAPSKSDTPSASPSGHHSSVRHHTACSFGIQWDITSLITLNSKKKSAGVHAESIDLEIAWREWQIAQSARLHLYHLIYIDKQIKAAEKHRNGLKQFRAAVDNGIEAGYVQISDVKQMQEALYQTNKLLITLNQQKKQEQLILKRLLGIGFDIDIPIQKDVKSIAVPQQLSADTFAENIGDHRLDLLALKMGYESQEERVRTEILNQFPKVTMGFLADRDTDRIRTAGFGVNIDLPIFDSNQGEIARARATRQQLFDEYIARLFESKNQIATIVANIDALQQKILLENQSIRHFKELAERYQETLQYTGNLIKLQVVHQTVRQKQINLLALKQKLTDMIIALELASGQYISEDGDSSQNIKISMKDIKK